MSTVTVVAIITAKPGQREALLAIARANLAAVRAEEGCIEYGLVVDVDGFGPNQAPWGRIPSPSSRSGRTKKR
jgi:quinol monooxygenase YgiN